MSLEYRTFRLLYATLKSDLGRSMIIDEAYAQGLITRQELDHINSGLTPDEKNGKLLDAVEVRIREERGKYYDFLNILKKEDTFSNLVEKLTSTFRELSEAEAQDTSSGNDSHREAAVNPPAPSPKASKPPTIDELTEQVKTIQWKKLGRKLGIEEFELNAIEENNPKNTKRALEDVLSQWHGSTAKPTWRAVVDALKAIKEIRLATKLEEDFC